MAEGSEILTPGTQEIFDGTYLIENVETKRYVFQDGDPIKGEKGAEGGWLATSGFVSPNVVGADANYYNRAFWKITPQGDGKHFIENVETKRYLFQGGDPIKGKRGDEGGWLLSSGFQSPNVVGADANYYNRASWRIFLQSDGKYFLENVETKRYLFQDGDPIKGDRQAEGGWLATSGFVSPNVVGADANYYNRAFWKITPQCDEILTPGTQEIFDGTYLIENVETKRYVFQDGDPIKGEKGAEGGWLATSGFVSPNIVGADANYYNRAFWKITPQGDGKHFIENVETKRYLFQGGDPIKGKRGDEGGWLLSSGFQSPNVVGADANYYNRAYWRIFLQSDGKYFLENVETKRYLFQDGDPIKGDRQAEGGWLASSGFQAPNVVGADANYYNRAYFSFTKV